MKVVATTKTTHNPFNETHRVSCLRENLTSSSDGEGLETGCALSAVPRQSFTRHEALWGHPGEKRMVVYYVGTEAPEALRGYLQTKLPEYMMPVVFMQLAALPLKPNGKVDRQALPVPERGGATWTYEAPRTPIKKLLTLSIR